MRKHFYLLIVCFAWPVGCERAPDTYPLMPDQVGTFELAEPSEGNYDWPVSKSGFAISRPPIYSSLIGISDQPLEPIDTKEIPPEEQLDDEAWAKFLQANGTNANHPFQLQPIHHEITSIPLGDSRVSFAFSSDGDRLYLCDGASVTAIELPDDWKDKVPLVGSSAGKMQKELWKWKIPKGSIGNPTLLAVSSTAKDVVDEFDFGLREDPATKAEKKDDEDKQKADKQKEDKSKEAAASSVRSDLVVVDTATTTRLDLNTGEVLASFPTPATGLDYMTPATDADVVLATNAEGEVFWNDGEAGKWVSVGTKVLPASQIGGRQSVALNSKGDAFLALDGKSLTNVWLSDGRKTTSADSTTTLDLPPTSLVWADNGRMWATGRNVYFAEPESEEGQPLTVNKIEMDMIWRPVSIWPQRVGRYRLESGMTVLGLRRLRDGRSMWSLWDQNSAIGGNSAPTNLFDDAALNNSTLADRKRPAIAVSIDASRFAYVDPESKSTQLKVFYRNPWESINAPGSEWVVRHINGNDEDRRDIDRAVARVRAMPMDFYGARPPEEVAGRVVFNFSIEAVSQWRSGYKKYKKKFENITKAREQGTKVSAELLNLLDSKHKDVGTWEESKYQELVKEYEVYLESVKKSLENFDRWLESGSLVAQLTHAAEFHESGYERGKYEEYEKRCEESVKLCRKILEQPRPPMFVFYNLYSAARIGNETHLSIEPEVRRCVKLYPECGSPHTNLGMWLLPHMGGNIGDTASYFQAAMSNVNPEMREKTFGMTAIRLAEEVGGNQHYFSATGISEKRAFRGVLKMLEEEKISNPMWLGGTIWVGSYCNNGQVVQAACRYMREYYLYPECNAYNDFASLFAECYADRPEPR